MSRVERKTHKLKLIGKTWTPWKEIPVTGEIRDSAPHMEHVWKIWGNSRYEVQAYQVKSFIGGVVQLVVARHQHLEAITWHECLRIKNELFGVDSLAVEIYPREEVREQFKVRVLWVLPEGHELPYGLHLETAWGGK